MSKAANLITITLIAAADLSAKQFYAVKIDNTGKAALAGAGEMACGILQNKPASGEAATIAVFGTTKAQAGGTVTAGDVVKADAAGKIVVASKGTTNTSDAGAGSDPLLGSNVLGIAQESAVDGDVFPVLITHSGAVPTTAS